MNCHTRPSTATEVERIAVVPSARRTNAKRNPFQLETAEDFEFGLEQMLESRRSAKEMRRGKSESMLGLFNTPKSVNVEPLCDRFHIPKNI
jgi:hypothetical protein